MKGATSKRVALKIFMLQDRKIKYLCYRTGRYTVCGRIRASFSPEILQAGAVKGLTLLRGDKECFFTGVTNQFRQSLEKDAGKRGSVRESGYTVPS